MSNPTPFTKRIFDIERRNNRRRELIAEIREVRSILTIVGRHDEVSPVVARWFSLKGFRVKPSDDYFTVSVRR